MGTQESPDFQSFERLQLANLPNAVRLNDKVISGGQPDGEAGFAKLKELGVKTVISVDGATPDLEHAHQYGMKYVHLPHGYNGISEQRAIELAKCVKELPGPIYIHCHHGKHRSPAAAAVASIGAGLMPDSAGLAVLKIAGTNKNYQGLFQAAESAKEFEAALLEQLNCDFPEVAQLPPMAEAMVELGHTMDHVKLLAENHWQTPEEHPDLVAVHESLILWEQFNEMLREHPEQEADQDFVAMLNGSAEHAERLHQILNSNDSNKLPFKAGEEAASALELILQNCKACHQKYRDVPLQK